ncbi:SusD/RagB family nutrient-binding outer membrane lipoprotein [Anditalea andensis]|uniref:Starch-binding protein n=1 Tax=Anditalea andensis TaxID=1048983 RepID=A0A074KW69_9BACT|nr:SusD/RagB family nutrient-binding outer membrane lipoprotein [Anditalea andensis]KEO72490.1 starch-binding protein [Anditalea andensis]
MKKKIYSFIFALSTLLVSSCDLDLLDSPNVVTAETASPTFLLNKIQIDYAALFNTTSTNGMRLTRMMSQPNSLYELAYVSVEYNTIWVNSYANILNDIKFLENLNESSPVPRHIGIAKVFKSMVLMTLVDYFNDIPFSQALDPNNLNPALDGGESVYAAAYQALQEAKLSLAMDTPNLPVDFYYNNDVARWIKLINSLELKYHLNRRLIDEAGSTSAINALVTTNNFISAGDDFVFRYGTSQSNPDSRHPRFSQYGSGGGDYQSTWYMWNLTEAKGFDDPRARYYIYRQVLVNPTDPDKLRCINEIAPSHYLAGGWPFCLPGNRGYWGRDHLNNEGIPPDGLEQSVYGIYPAGGKFDNDAGQDVGGASGANLGGQGAGVQPIMLAAFVDFMLAEAALTLGTTGDAKVYTLRAINKHMDYVRNYALSTADAANIREFYPDEEWSEAIAAYIAYVDNQYTQAGSNDARLNVIGREYWLSLFGNGNEAYNLHRRTGKPANMQPGLLASFGEYPRSFFYPNNYMVTNNTAIQKSSQRVRVFWDNNPEGFIY